MSDPATAPLLTRESVQAAHKLIEPYIHKTPVLTNSTITRLASTPRTPAELEGTEWAGRTPARPVMRLWFKCENLQRIGAFKARGAFHAIERLKQQPGWLEGGGREKGVVTHSSGNHAQALALAAQVNSIPAHIVMPTISSPVKIAAVRDTYGASIIFSGPTAPEREAVTASVIARTGAVLVPPYDHHDIVLGQGTMGLELQDQVSSHNKKLNAILTGCGGGGMLSGVALSCENTGIRVFGAEPSFEGADDAKRSFYSGQRITSVKSLTIADGLRTPVGAIPWSIIYERKLVSGMYSVTEKEIKAALRLVYERMKMVVEPSAVVGLATCLYNEDFRAMVEQEAGEDGWDIGLVFSGGNVSLEALGKLFES
ncbi:tryptophan synthase beta subunit-like PLP-dependent enzyme [Apodospora peruviana]|uniref:Tryptophan synthase beta subunit-like PLP-dependent enzyme n=1 Tax=Apodospora peruviana TaxID=516989 RepID=A0AAE0IIZ0_9PEZI|nr:tryptophan synthase beta subunit-like PLP-dependent enzyme [Apodospora peruviana]